MEERIFLSYVGLDFTKRFKDVFEVPSNIFEKECKHGYIWGIALNIEDPASSLTQLMLTAANSAAMFVVYASSDYRKIDKLKWEHDITTGEYKNHVLYDYIDDVIDDKYAEFIVSRDDFLPIYLICSGSTLAPRYDEDMFALDKMFLNGFSEQARSQLRRAFKNGYYGIRNFNMKYRLNSGSTVVSSVNLRLNEQETSAIRMVSSTMFYFTAVLAPIVVICTANYKRNEKGLKLLPYTVNTDYYFDKYGHKLMLDRMDSVRFFADACNGGKVKYDRIYNKIYSYFDFERNLMLADKTDCICRNDPCPCGSGKKWKHCCGKRR